MLTVMPCGWNPAFYEAHYNLATDVRSSKQPCCCAAGLRKSSRDSPRFSGCQCTILRSCSWETDILKTRINEFEKVIAAHPTEARAHLALGNIYAQELSISPPRRRSTTARHRNRSASSASQRHYALG
jgi:hypothetical protein